MEIELVGGAHDGMKLSTGLGQAAFLWTDGKRCFRAPRHGRALYRLMGQSSVGLREAESCAQYLFAKRYRFVGHLYGLCACGVYRKRSERCRLCGSAELAA